MFIFLTSSIYAQDSLLLEKTYRNIKGQCISVDQYDNLYVVDSVNDIVKYTNGVRKEIYSTMLKSEVSQLQNSTSTTLFSFYKDLQLVRYYDRFMSEKATLELQDVEIEFAGAVCQSLNNQLWVYDEASLSLKKVSFSQKEVVYDISLVNIISEDSEIVQMIEYQNMLILLNKNKGIYVFDNMGGFKNYYLLPNITTFTPFKESLIYLTEKAAFSFNLYTYESLKLNTKKQYKGLSANAIKVFMISDTEVDVYSVAK